MKQGLNTAYKIIDLIFNGIIMSIKSDNQVIISLMTIENLT